MGHRTGRFPLADYMLLIIPEFMGHLSPRIFQRPSWMLSGSHSREVSVSQTDHCHLLVSLHVILNVILRPSHTLPFELLATEQNPRLACEPHAAAALRL